MRSYEGQLSDNRPIKRTREEKQRQLAELEQQRAALKQHTSPALRQAIEKRIIELREELARAPEPRRGDRCGRRAEAQAIRGADPHELTGAVDVPPPRKPRRRGTAIRAAGFHRRWGVGHSAGTHRLACRTRLQPLDS